MDSDKEKSMRAPQTKIRLQYEDTHSLSLIKLSIVHCSYC